MSGYCRTHFFQDGDKVMIGKSCLFLQLQNGCPFSVQCRRGIVAPCRS
ncbi:MAG: hypothetical protein KJ846_03895 [Proteobacteria bacterium]|nr:hypothetical protein [Pseudomonadota bacterium]